MPSFFMQFRKGNPMKQSILSRLLCLLAATALLLTGCGSQTTPAASQEQEIVFAASRDQCPGEQDAYYASMSLGIWEPLITKDADGKPIPALADSLRQMQILLFGHSISRKMSASPMVPPSMLTLCSQTLSA